MCKKLCKKLKKARLKKGLSLKEASLILNISVEELKDYEAGKFKIDSRVIIKFADAYKMLAKEILEM